MGTRALGFCGMVVLAMTSCALIDPVDERDLPTLRLKTDRLREDPRDRACPSAGEVTLLRGPQPAGTDVIATLTLTAVDRAAPLATYESVLRQWSAKHCIEGVSVLRADAADEGRAILAVVAEAWIVLPPGTAPPAAPSTPPPPDPEQEFWD